MRPEQVLGVAPGIITGAARCDHNILNVASGDLSSQGFSSAALFLQESFQHMGLFVDFPVDVGRFQIDHLHLVC